MPRAEIFSAIMKVRRGRERELSKATAISRYTKKGRLSLEKPVENKMKKDNA